MSPQSEGRPLTDRRVGDGGSGNRGPPRSQSYEPVNQQMGTNGYLASDAPQQRFMGSAMGDDENTNGSLPPSPVDGRDGRDRNRDNTMILPIRERSRTNGHAGSQSSGGTLRFCNKCDEPLTGQFVRALEGTFHLQCFRCRVSALISSPRVRINTTVAGLLRNCRFEILPR